VTCNVLVLRVQERGRWICFPRYVATAELVQGPLLALDTELARSSGPACEITTPPDPED
jgi:hypothetical protein